MVHGLLIISIIARGMGPKEVDERGSSTSVWVSGVGGHIQTERWLIGSGDVRDALVVQIRVGRASGVGLSVHGAAPRS